ncbi:YmfQ family protein [Gluconobacter kondonii]|uniref:YmfQ family protein n=1 Tax=Gluconobacter kondonii TaxID=941463 RepID=UPI0019821D18|nr:putative phage tail protein [Gluconobacter kondonii]MBN3866462.1 DUF2313 domain-containing protein [Gluconobacter kondonii]
MSTPIFSADNFRQALLRLLPRGAIWSRDPADLLSLLASAWGQVFARNTQSAADLLVETFPATTAELITEWERSTGLPDPCAGQSPTLLQRRAQVVARLTDSGGSSIAYYVAFAAALGFDITITEYTAARAGALTAGSALYGESWTYVWTVTAPGTTTTYFIAGAGTAGSPLANWGNAVLECEIRARCPAHTLALFAQND